MVALSIRAKTATGIFGVSGLAENQADFALRAAGSRYASDWRRIFLNGSETPAREMLTKQDIIDEAVGIGASSWPGGVTEAATHLDVDTTIQLYGQSLRFNTFNTDAAASGSWAFNPTGAVSSALNRFYAQFDLYIDRNSLAYRYDIEPGFPQQLKILNLGQNGAGQIAITIRRFLAIISYFSQTASFHNAGDATIQTPNPWSSAQEWMHNGINNAGTPTTKDEYLAKYGPLQGSSGGMITDEGSGYSYNAANPYLYNRGLSHGWPDTRIANPINFNGWTQVEVFAEYLGDGSQSTVQIWMAPRGSAPVLICSQVGTLPLSGGGNDWDRFEFLAYDTHRLSEAGRPTLYLRNGGFIISESPIPFTGGFIPPNNQGGPSTTPLDVLANSLASGQSALLTGVTWTGTDVPTGSRWNWNNKWFLDEARDIGYVATKAANVDADMTHGVYDRVNNAFRFANCGFNRSGHVYDCVAYDYVSGRGFLVPGGGRDQKLWFTDLVAGSNPALPTAFSEDAFTTCSSVMYSGAADFVSGEGSMDFHPNLFGTGDGGHVIVCQLGLIARRKSTGLYSVILAAGQFTGPDAPSCVYSRGLDACIVCVNVSSNKAFRVDRFDSITQIANTPILFGPDHSDRQAAALVDDPKGNPTVWALDHLGTAVWKYSAGTWAEQIGLAHPFQGLTDGASVVQKNFAVAADYKTGTLVTLERTSGNCNVRVWDTP